MKALRQKTVFIIMLVISLALIFSGLKVYASAQIMIEGDLELGAVDISLSSVYDDSIQILPGQSLPYSPVIKNNGSECYIRAKYSIGAFEKHISPADFPEGWKEYPDGYGYYTQPLKTNDRVAFFNALLISPDLPEDSVNVEPDIKITVEAVQTKNFIPDFMNNSPWGDTKIETYTSTEKYVIGTETGERISLSVVYEGSADKLVSNSKDFFANMPSLMPGDEYSDTISLKNTYHEPIDLYFYTNADQDDELLKHADLLIRSGDKGVIYQGPLNAGKINGTSNAVLLSSVSSAKDEEMTFTISLPKELTNRFALWKSDLKWIFYTDPDRPTVTPPPGKAIVTNAPETGDEMNAGFYMMLFGAALAVLAAGMFVVKKE